LTLDWSLPNENLCLTDGEISIKTIAFLGGICLGRGVVNYLCFEKSVKTDRFIEYLKNLHEVMNGQKYCIYLDNLAVHKTLRVKELMEEYQVELIFAPVGSPDYNSIEYTFSILKNNVRRSRFQ
jgi:hypothetical protein